MLETLASTSQHQEAITSIELLEKLQLDDGKRGTAAVQGYVYELLSTPRSNRIELLEKLQLDDGKRGAAAVQGYVYELV